MMNAAACKLAKFLGPQQRQVLQSLMCMAVVGYCYAFRFATAFM